MIVSRRAVLAGALALPVAPGSGVGAALDRAASLPPAEALRSLAGLTGATPSERLDLAAARSGLAIDAELARFPPRAEQRAALAALRDRGTPGASGLPDGERYLLLEMRRQLGDAATLDAAERRLRAEHAHVEVAADRLLRQVGLSSGSTGARFGTLWRIQHFLYADDDAGRARAVADMDATLAALRPRVAAAFGVTPPPATVRALSLAAIAAGKGGYRDLPVPGRAGAYVVDLKEVRRRPAWTLPSVVAHETLPGHLLQLPVEALAPPHPLRMTYAGAFVEGWGMYAEGWAARVGLYAGPHAMLGHLHWLLFRLGRALVDLGVHRRGMTLEQARATLEAWQGEPAYFAPFETDLPRIAVEPGVRAAEALAWLGLADRARDLSGDRLAAFHRAVLIGGRRRLEQL